MKVILLAHTDYAQEIVASAGKTCYSAKTPSDCFLHFVNDASEEDIKKQLSIIHGSCFEHCTFTFGVDGVSRVTTHQLVRHRLASFSQQSQRYVDVHKTWRDLVIPLTVEEVIESEEILGENYSDEPMLQAVDKFKFALEDLINELDKHMIPSEDIRYFIPQGTKTNIIVTMNARELAHFLSLRMCKRAQWEIREMAYQMWEIVNKKFPLLSEALKLGASCDQFGFCPEHRPCGKVKPLSVLLKESEEDA